MQKGLFGKLPSHGDFVARGLTVSQRQTLDRWITQNIGQMGLPENGIRLRWTLGRDVMIGAVVASKDKAGRVFPIVAVAPDTADAWADTAATVLDQAIENSWDAQTCFENLPLPTTPPGAEFTQPMLWHDGAKPQPLDQALRALSSG